MGCVLLPNRSDQATATGDDAPPYCAATQFAKGTVPVVDEGECARTPAYLNVGRARGIACFVTHCSRS